MFVEPDLRFSEAQRRRQDSVSRQIMTYSLKRTPEQRADEQTRTAAAEAAKEQKRKERIDKAVDKDLAKQKREMERFFKRQGI